MSPMHSVQVTRYSAWFPHQLPVISLHHFRWRWAAKAFAWLVIYSPSGPATGYVYDAEVF